MSDQRPSPHRLSKSKLAAFEHCPKRLWLQVHRRDAAQHDAETLARFRFGHEVGERARLLTKGGVLVETGFDMIAALTWTAELIASGRPQPIFEGTFVHQNVLIRADILTPDGAGGWHATEVKAASRPKPTHLSDLGTQLWVMAGAGVTISRASIRHVEGPIDWSRLDATAVRFRDEDVTARIGRYIKSRPAVVAAAERTVRQPRLDVPMGRHCERPFACEFVAHCRSELEVPLLAAG